MTGKEFFRNVQEIAGLRSESEAKQHTLTVCCALAMRLYGGEPKDFLSQLPHEISHATERCVTEPKVKWNLDEFLSHVMDQDELDRQQAERSAKAVFRVLKTALSRGEVEDIESMLPSDIKEFFIKS